MSKLKHIGLQFFAEDPAQPPADQQPPTQPETQPEQQEKTFTQAEVTRMMTAEKKQGRNAVLKELGLDPDAADIVKNTKSILDGLKTQQERDAEALKAAQSSASTADARATAAERKLTVLMSGCNKDFVDEVMALASAKVTDTVDFEAALQQVKEKCTTFWDEAPADTGTGKGQGGKRNDTKLKAGDYARELAKKSSTGKPPAENPYFTN